MKGATPLACVVLAILVGAASVPGAQGRGGAVPGPQGRGGKPAAVNGTVERIMVHGKALEGNLEGDSPDRDVTVYLPPSYADDQARRYPVVYLLHGYGGRDDTFTARLAALAESSDTLAAAQGFSSAIVVTPNAFSLHKGSMYSNSPTTGDWERFIAEDLVAYIDGHYRTLPEPHEPWAGRSLDGRLWCAADRDEAPGRVLEPVHDEFVLPDREPQPERRDDGGCGSDQDSRAG